MKKTARGVFDSVVNPIIAVSSNTAPVTELSRYTDDGVLFLSTAHDKLIPHSPISGKPAVHDETAVEIAYEEGDTKLAGSCPVCKVNLHMSAALLDALKEDETPFHCPACASTIEMSADDDESEDDSEGDDDEGLVIEDESEDDSEGDDEGTEDDEGVEDDSEGGEEEEEEPESEEDASKCKAEEAKTARMKAIAAARRKALAGEDCEEDDSCDDSEGDAEVVEDPEEEDVEDEAAKAAKCKAEADAKAAADAAAKTTATETPAVANPPIVVEVPAAPAPEKITLDLSSVYGIKSSDIRLMAFANNDQMLLMSEGKPLGVFSKARVSEDKHPLFNSGRLMRDALIATLAGDKNLASLGFEPFQVTVDVASAVLEKARTEAAAETASYKEKSMASMAQYRHSLQIAAAGANKGLYDNPIASALTAQLKLHGVSSPNKVVASVIASASDAYITGILAKATELSEMSDDARNAIATMIKNSPATAGSNATDKDSEAVTSVPVSTAAFAVNVDETLVDVASNKTEQRPNKFTNLWKGR